MTVAQEIFRQLGGNRFAVMTGAKYFMADGNTLTFCIPRNASKANYVRITLNGKDLYDVEFKRIKAAHFSIKTGRTSKEINETVKEYNDVYCDNLQSIFTHVTGMYTRLF